MNRSEDIDDMRRRLLQAFAAGSALAVGLGPRAADAGTVRGRSPTDDAVKPGVFSRPLPVPPQLHGQPDAQGVLHYALQAGSGGHSELIAGVRTPTWGYNGALLGPTLRVPRGKPLQMQVSNGLKVPTTVHWHGAQVPGKMDGGPHNLIAPGTVWKPAFTLDQPAGTLWYHPHPHTYTGPQVYAGLAGFLLVDDGVDAQLGLPHTYGVDDLPLAFQDRRLDEAGRLVYMNRIPDTLGMKGDHFLVNGVEQPYVNVSAGWLRLRLLNASNARLYNFAFADGREFHVIAGDAGLLEHPVSMRSLLLGPAERSEIMVDLRHDQGHTLVLRSDSGAVVPGLYHMSQAVDAYDHGRIDLLQLRVGARSGLSSRLPVSMVPAPKLHADGPESDFVLSGMMHRGMKIITSAGSDRRAADGPGGMNMGVGGHDLFAINKHFMRMNVINVQTSLGRTALWRVKNTSGMAHPFHVHGTSFVIHSRNGRPAPAHQRGWNDTILMRHEETAELFAPFKYRADADHPYMYHCHILEHEDNGMMGQFTVV